MKTHLLVIDPGASGGSVFRPASTADGQLIVIRPFNSALAAALDVESISWVLAHTQVVIESVHASPVQSQSSSFAFGKNFGIWLGILAAHGINPLGMTPQQWQMPLNAAHRSLVGLTGSKRKSALNRIAKNRHPSNPVTLETCDALLMSDYCVEYVRTHGFAPGKLIS